MNAVAFSSEKREKLVLLNQVVYEDNSYHIDKYSNLREIEVDTLILDINDRNTIAPWIIESTVKIFILKCSNLKGLVSVNGCNIDTVIIDINNNSVSHNVCQFDNDTNIGLVFFKTDFRTKASVWCLFDDTKIEKIINEMTTPEANYGIATQSVFRNTPLYVPTNSKIVYESTGGWKEFWNITESEQFTNVTIPNGDVFESNTYYRVSGIATHTTHNPLKGLNIRKGKNGKAVKIIVK